MRFGRLIAVVLFVVTAGVVAVGPPAAANQVGTPPGGVTTVLDTDIASFGVGGMRGTGAGTISVEGITGTISQALLYWNGPTNSTDPSANASVTFDGSSFTGTQIGFSNDNCWSFSNSQSYRADVTAEVTGNGTYALSNFRKTDVDLDTIIADVNGASLIVFYDDGNPSNNRDVTLVDGNDSNVTNSFDPDGWDATIAAVPYGGGPADLQLHVSDGQSFEDGQVVLNDTQLLAQGPNFEGDSVPGDGGATFGNLWDIKMYDITTRMSTPSTTLHLTSPLINDCLSLVVALVAVESAAIGVPGPPTINQALAGNTEVGLNWSAPDSDDVSPITKYKVYANPCPSDGEGACVVLDNVSPMPNSGSTFNYVIGGLTNGTTYSFTVTASNENGEGPPSEPATATPTASADTDTIQANGAGTVDTGFAGGANSSDPSCSSDPSSVSCKNIVARYSLVDRKNVGAVIGLASVPDDETPGGPIACLEFEFTTNQVDDSPDCETVAGKALLSIYPTNVETLVRPHFAFEQNDRTVTTDVIGAPCFQLVTNSNGTPMLATNGDPICKKPDFPRVFGPGPKKTNMCPDGTGWTATKPCAYIYYKVERIDGYDLSPADCATTWPNCTWGTLANPKARRPVQCTPGPTRPTCGKEVIIGSTIVAGIKLASGEYAVRPWCQGSWGEGEPPPSNIKWLPCDLLVVWLNFVRSTSVHYNDVLWTDLEVNDPGGKRTG